MFRCIILSIPKIGIGNVYEEEEVVEVREMIKSRRPKKMR